MEPIELTLANVVAVCTILIDKYRQTEGNREKCLELVNQCEDLRPSLEKVRYNVGVKPVLARLLRTFQEAIELKEKHDQQNLVMRMLRANRFEESIDDITDRIKTCCVDLNLENSSEILDALKQLNIKNENARRFWWKSFKQSVCVDVGVFSEYFLDAFGQEYGISDAHMAFLRDALDTTRDGKISQLEFDRYFANGIEDRLRSLKAEQEALEVKECEVFKRCLLSLQTPHTSSQVEALKYIENFGNRAHLFELLRSQPIVEALVCTLQFKPSFQQAARTMGMVVERDGMMQDLLRQAGALSIIVKRLRETDVDARASAVFALCFLIRHHETNSLWVANEGALPYLYEIAQSSRSIEERKFAFKTVGYLGEYKQNHERILSAGFLPLLVQSLSSPDESLRRLCAAAVHNLAADAVLASGLCGVGLPSTCIELLSLGSADDEVDRILNILATLAEHPDCRSQLCGELIRTKGFARIISLVRDGSLHTSHTALVLVHRLLYRGECKVDSPSSPARALKAALFARLSPRSQKELSNSMKASGIIGAIASKMRVIMQTQAKQTDPSDVLMFTKSVVLVLAIFAHEGGSGAPNTLEQFSLHIDILTEVHDLLCPNELKRVLRDIIERLPAPPKASSTNLHPEYADVTLRSKSLEKARAEAIRMHIPV